MGRRQHPAVVHRLGRSQRARLCVRHRAGRGRAGARDLEYMGLKRSAAVRPAARLAQLWREAPAVLTAGIAGVDHELSTARGRAVATYCPYLDQASIWAEQRERWLRISQLPTRIAARCAAARGACGPAAARVSPAVVDPVRHALLSRQRGSASGRRLPLIREIGRGGMSSVWLAERWMASCSAK